MEQDDFVDINLEEIEDPRELIPAGPTNCRVKSVEKKKNPDGEYPFLDIRLNPVGGPNPKKTLRVNHSFSPGALWAMHEFVTKCGLEWKSKGFFYRDLIGKEINVNVGVEPSRNDPNVKVNTVNMPYHKA